MSAMIGAAISTEPPTDRDGDLVSPARIATYSNPPSAPNPILPSKLRLKTVNAGASVLNGWYAGRCPVASPMNGSRSTAPNTSSMNTPPTLCTHLPTDSPIVEATTIAASITIDDSVTNQLLDVIHAARGPIAYER